MFGYVEELKNKITMELDVLDRIKESCTLDVGEWGDEEIEI